MIKTFPIDFITRVLEQTLLEEHIKDNYFFGGEEQLKLVSFYEQVRSNEEVSRYVELYKDIIDQQNRTNLIGLGICSTTENPTITNVYSSTIIPMTWTCSVRCLLENRDRMNDTINNTISKLKGKKVDVALLKCQDEHDGFAYIPFKVGTIGYSTDETPQLEIKSGDFIGYRTRPLVPLNINNIIADLVTKGFQNTLSTNDYLYESVMGKLKVFQKSFKKVSRSCELELEDFTNYNVGDQTCFEVSFRMVCVDDPSDEQQVPTNPEDFKTEAKVKLYDSANRSYVTTLHLKANEVENPTTRFIAYYSAQIFLPTNYFLDLTDVDLELNDGDTSGDVYYETSQTDWALVENDGLHPEIVFPPEHDSFKEYKVSFSCDSTRVDTPMTLNGKQYCNITFSGSATIVDKSVKLGNDLICVSLKKSKILGSPNYVYEDEDTYYLDPLEMGSGINAAVLPLQISGNNFKSNTHTESTTNQIKYSFVLNEDIVLLKQLFYYSRYGTYKDDDEYVISPNLIFELKEYYCAWGNADVNTFKVKLVDTVDLDNTESDVLTLGIKLQIQGDENYGNDL